MDVTIWILLPLLGTALGAAAVFADDRRRTPMAALEGLAAGVMMAASVWSLILPAIEKSAGYGRLAFLPAAVGIWLGYGFVDRMGRFLPGDGDLTVAAVTLHNLPEGMAVGVAAAGSLSGDVSLAACAALSFGIALQNLPEGAIVSLPLAGSGMTKGKAFSYGVLSGAVEPAGAILALCFASLASPALPWMLSFSAGAMLYVAVKELIPKMECRSFFLGFLLMMVLDVALG